MCSALLADIGMIAVPTLAVADETASGRLIRVLENETLRENGIYGVFLSNCLITSKVRFFGDYLTPVLRQRMG